MTALRISKIEKFLANPEVIALQASLAKNVLTLEKPSDTVTLFHY